MLCYSMSISSTKIYLSLPLSLLFLSFWAWSSLNMGTAKHQNTRRIGIESTCKQASRVEKPHSNTQINKEVEKFRTIRGPPYILDEPGEGAVSTDTSSVRRRLFRIEGPSPPFLHTRLLSSVLHFPLAIRLATSCKRSPPLFTLALSALWGRPLIHRWKLH